MAEWYSITTVHAETICNPLEILSSKLLYGKFLFTMEKGIDTFKEINSDHLHFYLPIIIIYISIYA